MKIHGVRQALNDHHPCGDAFLWWQDGPYWTICLADGLGHGAEAALAAEAALTEAARWKSLSPNDILGKADDAIRGSRGAAMTVVRIDAAGRMLEHSGVGNVRAALFGDKVRRLEGKPGIVGTGFKLGAPQCLPWRDNELFVLWTDGLNASLALDPLSLRRKDDVELLSARLIDQFSSRRDDSCVVCCLLEQGLA